MIRVIDFLAAAVVLIIGAPFLIIFAVFIVLEDGWPIFFKQERVGLNGKPFTMYKLRSMRNRKEGGMQITVGGKDPRVLKIGYPIRKYKLDEIPQLINVLKGDMSLVGPRPEVKRFTDLYNEDQRKVLKVRPGITDFASIEYSNENELLEGVENPEQFYIDELMPKKIELNMIYANDKSLKLYFQIIFKTLSKIIKH